MLEQECIALFVRSIINEIDNLTLRAIYGKLQRNFSIDELVGRLQIINIKDVTQYILDGELLIEFYPPDITKTQTHYNANIRYKVYE